MDEYLSYALDRESTKVVALLLETVRRPEGFVAALAKAAERDVPVFALKVGRTEGSKQMVVAHSGALAGEHGAYEAVFDAYGVHECRDLEEMADALELFSSPRRVTEWDGDRVAPRLGRGTSALRRPRGRPRRPVRGDLGGDARPDRRGARPRARRREPAGRLGDRHRRRPDLRRELPGAPRRSRDRGGRVRRGPHAAGRALRRRVPPGGAGCVRGHDEAVLRDLEPPGDDRRRRGRDPPRRRDPRARGHGDRPAGAASISSPMRRPRSLPAAPIAARVTEPGSRRVARDGCAEATDRLGGRRPRPARRRTTSPSWTRSQPGRSTRRSGRPSGSATRWR